MYKISVCRLLLLKLTKVLVFLHLLTIIFVYFPKNVLRHSCHVSMPHWYEKFITGNEIVQKLKTAQKTFSKNKQSLKILTTAFSIFYWIIPQSMRIRKQIKEETVPHVHLLGHPHKWLQIQTFFFLYWHWHIALQSP